MPLHDIFFIIFWGQYHSSLKNMVWDLILSDWLSIVLMLQSTSLNLAYIITDTLYNSSPQSKIFRVLIIRLIFVLESYWNWIRLNLYDMTGIYLVAITNIKYMLVEYKINFSLFEEIIWILYLINFSMYIQNTKFFPMFCFDLV